MTVTHRPCAQCGQDIRVEASFCSFCGAQQGAQVVNQPPAMPNQSQQLSPPAFQAPVSNQPYFEPQETRQRRRSSDPVGMSIASLIIGAISVVVALIDIGSVSNGDYAYILYSEVGFLFILSAAGLGIGIGAAVRKERYSVGALVVSGVAMLLTLVTSTMGG